MKASLLVVFSAPLLTINLSAQIASVKELPPEFNETRQAWYEPVENQDSRSIIALHASYRCHAKLGTTNSGKEVYVPGGYSEYDALGNPVDLFADHKGVPGGEATEINVPADPSKCSGGIDAVIFANGQIEGSSRWVNEFRNRWNGIHAAVIEVLPRLSKVANHDADMAEFADFVRHRLESIPDKSADPAIFGERGVYIELESLLRTVHEENATSDSTLSSQPRGDEVAVSDGSGILKNQQQKAAAFLIDRFQAWKTDLENASASPAN
jgi:hypothetical protein